MSEEYLAMIRRGNEAFEAARREEERIRIESEANVREAIRMALELQRQRREIGQGNQR